MRAPAGDTVHTVDTSAGRVRSARLEVAANIRVTDGNFGRDPNWRRPTARPRMASAETAWAESSAEGLLDCQQHLPARPFVAAADSAPKAGRAPRHLAADDAMAQADCPSRDSCPDLRRESRARRLLPFSGSSLGWAKTSSSASSAREREVPLLEEGVAAVEARAPVPSSATPASTVIRDARRAPKRRVPHPAHRATLAATPLAVRSPASPSRAGPSRFSGFDRVLDPPSKK